MKNVIIGYAFLVTVGIFSINSFADDADKIIKKEEAIQVALAELEVEILGIRFDEPDNQWDVFIRSGEQAYEIEVDAVNGKVVAAEKESLEEIQTELSGDLSHEGVSGDVDK